MHYASGRVSAMFLVAIALLSVAARAADGPMVRILGAMDSTDGVDVQQGEARVVAEGPGGKKVLRFDDRFRVRLEPGRQGIDPRDFGLIKIAVKADACAVLKVDLQNHPGPGDRSYWWALDGIRGAFGWRTLWLDLRVIEDIKARDDKRDPWREGAEGGKGTHALTLEGFIKDTGRDAAGGDVILYADWRIEKGGDSGIFLRGRPQVQIWDVNRHKEGSGGLWNNKETGVGRDPLVPADNPVGEWNTFRIHLVGRKVTVHLNGKLVVDAAPMETLRKGEGMIEQGPIVLQHHGHPLWFRNVFVKRLGTESAKP